MRKSKSKIYTHMSLEPSVMKSDKTRESYEKKVQV